MDYYCLGFAFDQHSSRVALIRKNKPDWQKGKYNGIGGKVESGETTLEAMVREFKEETDCETKPQDWKNVCHLDNNDFSMGVFKTVLDFDKISAYENSPTDEQIHFIDKTDYDTLTEKSISNILWLVYMCLEETDKTYYFYGKITHVD